MTSISRRSLLGSSALLPVALVGCASLSNNSIDTLIATVSRDVNVITTLLSNALKQMAALKVPGLTGDILNVVQSALSGLSSTAVAISGATDTAGLQSGVQKVATYVTVALTALASIPLMPVPIAALLAGASILVPVIAAAVQLVLPPPVTPPNAPAVTPDQARQLAVTS